ncbi:hypothetical protein HELRODRAFT_182580 [Helobdella robusta]|uniref:C-type lectin domain-containing protein n=1 Tax=Helobdella robusta TaxID=6412 RepID=T1FIE3_HELRO|nr:hypothetical protein HELRODRAFT_182580 [Helobdella robusta]ESN90871.1 hypothetical protein HELRODRAFT_182580 [Helobdella robusta]
MGYTYLAYASYLLVCGTPSFRDVLSHCVASNRLVFILTTVTVKSNSELKFCNAKGFCLHYPSRNTTLDGARSYCATRNSTLMAPSDAGIMHWVENLMKIFSNNIPDLTKVSFWLNAKNSSGVFYWNVSNKLIEINWTQYRVLALPRGSRGILLNCNSTGAFQVSSNFQCFLKATNNVTRFHRFFCQYC